MSDSLIEGAISTRMSVRAFTKQPVSRALVTEVLASAAQTCANGMAPDWRVHVLQGKRLTALCDKVCAAHDAVRADPTLLAQYREPYDYYPEKWSSPYIDRRRENGWGLYGLLGIGKGDKDKMHAQHQRNYRFFDAPIGLMFTLDRTSGGEALLLFGMFLQSVMLAARLRNLHSCPQAAWNSFSPIILPHIGAGPDEVLVCGMSLGHADTAAVVNRFHTPRVPVQEFCHPLA